VSEELEASLRAAVESHFNERLRQINEELSRLQEDFNGAIARLRKSSIHQSWDGSQLESSIAEHLQSARTSTSDEAAVSNASQTSENFAVINKAVAEIEGQRSQVDVLNALLTHAAHYADRTALFVIRNEQGVGWRAAGPQGTIADESLRKIVMPLTSDTLLSYVARSRTAWSGVPGSNAEDNSLLEKLGAQPERIAAVPLVVRGKTVAVLYADASSTDPNAINVDALETLARVASMAVALVSVARASSKPAPEVLQPSEPGQQFQSSIASVSIPASVESKVDEPKTETVEESVSVPEADSASPMPAPAVISAPVAPPVPALSSAPSFGSEYVAPLGTARRWGATEPELPIEVNEDERRLHTDARRFARLLVSEIKLYNEQKVNEGRAQGDIYERLRDDIERSRQMYEKRIAPPVAARYDYFHQELVNTLAEGDPTRLGASYPGAMVAVG
jgi:hypothetical protein